MGEQKRERVAEGDREREREREREKECGSKGERVRAVTCRREGDGG